MMQTPSSPVAGGTSGGRKTSKRIILVCHGFTQTNTEVCGNDLKVDFDCIFLASLIIWFDK